MEGEEIIDLSSLTVPPFLAFLVLVVALTVADLAVCA